MVQPAPRPRTDAPPDTAPDVDPVNQVTAGATGRLQEQARNLFETGSGSGSAPRIDLASVVQSGFELAQDPRVQAMLANVIIAGLPGLKTEEGASGPKNVPDSFGGLVKEGKVLTGSGELKAIPDGGRGVVRSGDTNDGPKVVRDDGRGLVRPDPIRRPHDLPPHNPGSGEGGVLTGHTVKIPDLGSLNKPGKGSDSGDVPAPLHSPGSDIMSKELKAEVIKRYQQLSAAITGIAEGLTDGSTRSQVEEAASEAETETQTPEEDLLADGVVDIDEAIALFEAADQADAALQQKVDKLLENIPEGPVRDLMKEASSQLLETGQLDTETIQRMLKDAKETLGNNEFWNQMGGVMTDFSPEFSKQFGIGLTLNRAENVDGDMQEAILVSQRTGSGRDNGKLTIMAITETGAPQVTQHVTTRGGTSERQLSDDPAELFNTFANAALEYYGEHQ